MKKIIAIVGPTASGKSELAVKLTRKFNGEIISADSRQIYKGLDIGTAKDIDPSVNHHMIDIIEPDQRFSAADYQKMADRIIKSIEGRSKIPFLVGGTGLYIDAVLRGYDWQSENKPRGYKGHRPKYRSLEIALDISRDKLYKNINRRVIKMMENGLIEETRDLVKKYGPDAPALKETIGYKEILCRSDILCHSVKPEGLIRNPDKNNWIPGQARNDKKKDIIQQIQNNTRAYARRQMTWFRRHGDIHWVKNYKEAEELVRSFLCE